MTKQYIFSCAISLALPHVTFSSSPTPKMLGEPFFQGKTLGPERFTQTISTSSATFVGDCHPEKPFEFPLPGTSGRGVIGVEGEYNSISASYPDGGIDLVTAAPEQDFFGFDAEDSSNFWGWPIQYENTIQGNIVVVECKDPTPVIVFANDDSRFTIEATIDESPQGKTLKLSDSMSSTKPLKGKGLVKGQGRNPVGFANANSRSIEVRHEKGNNSLGVAIIQAEVSNSEGKRVIRSFVMESKEGQEKTQKPINVKCCDINEDGDVEMSFPNLGQPGTTYRVDVRLALLIAEDGEADGLGEEKGVVDYTAMLEVGQKMTVNGGWIRTAIQENGLEGDTAGWDIKVQDLVVSDPDDGYRIVGVFDKKNQAADSNRIPPGQANKKSKLSQAPSFEEANISDAMKQGRKPKDNESSNPGQRNLQTGKKILVHGYCARDPDFPGSHFTNEIRFSDPDTTNPVKSNWSHITFAQKIGRFAVNNGISSCGCIAHSQGGAACLTLYRYYWSCLDYGSGNRMIQSVGTPYQGTALAGNIAAIGDVFGAGCGTNQDMTYSGAATWLNNIPSWARSKVHHYTTSFEDKCYRYDYCHLASDIILGDPDDGTTEKAKGQLPGGNNRGHKQGWCHSFGMRDPHQSTDYSRNVDMNANAYQ